MEIYIDAWRDFEKFCADNMFYHRRKQQMKPLMDEN